MVLKKETNKQKKPKKKNHLSTFPLGIDEFLL